MDTVVYKLPPFQSLIYVGQGNVKQVQPGKHRTKAQAAMLFTSGKMTNSRCGTSGAAAPPVAIEAAKE
ncbi:hypothetical protein Tco_0535045 [Tanacetum coccineum]